MRHRQLQSTETRKRGKMKLRLLLLWAIIALAISGCTAPIPTQAPTATATEAAPKEWEYKSETVTYSRECLAEAIKPYRSDETIMLAVQIARGDSALALANIQQLLCVDTTVSPVTVNKITDAYATCAAEFEDTYLNEMGRQGWEMVSLSRLEETVPGGQWCNSITVVYGFEVAWKRLK
jgi:hypothetical protein